MLYSSFLSSADLRRLQQPEREWNQSSLVVGASPLWLSLRWLLPEPKVVSKLAFAPTRHY
jgi:hypothetical protein